MAQEEDIDFDEILRENVVIKDLLFSGNTRTKSDFIEDQIKDLIGAKLPLSRAMAVINRRFAAFRSFDQLRMGIEKDTDEGNVPPDQPYPIRIRFDIKERFKYKGWMGLKGSLDDATVPVITINGTIPNTFGRAEEVHADLGVKLPSFNIHGTVAVRFPKYKNGELKGERTLVGFTTKSDHSESSGYSSHLTGGDLTQTSFQPIFGTPSPSSSTTEPEMGYLIKTFEEEEERKKGTIGYTGGFCFHCRQVFPVHSAPLRILRWAGNSVKSSFTYKATYDTRVNPLAPTSGNLLQATGEVAGLGGDLAFVKANACFQTFRSLPFGWTLSLVGRGGGLYSFANHLPGFLGEFKDPGPLDRFFIGGQSSVRGFKERGAGPRQNGFALGGNFFAEGFISATKTLPPPFPNFMHFHTFLDSGTIGDQMSHLRQNLRVVGGSGLVVTGLGCRIELNVINRIVTSGTDAFRGFEIRFSPDMM